MSVRPKIYDNHGRPIEYVRLAVTDRCNLRCFYCMPAEGIRYVARKALLSFEEMKRLIHILASLGITKVRITGGEPFLRKEISTFIHDIARIEGIEAIHITTNGVLTTPYVPSFKEIGIQSVNLSLDTLNPKRFFDITRRDVFPEVMKCLEALLAHGIPTKINAVIMEGKNTEDIIELAEFTKDRPVSVRFIEEMPFNGSGGSQAFLPWNHKKILARLQEVYPNLTKLPDGKHSTAAHYQVPGYKGNVGIIAAFTRTFCGSCNRIRITPQGQLKTCLYDNGVLNIRDMLRENPSDEPIIKALLSAFQSRAKDGFEAEMNRKDTKKVGESMATIGG